MLVTLVPLILAANISTNVGDWKYGPEVIYDAKLDNVINDRIMSVVNVTAKFTCRPKTELVLSCRIYEPRILYTVINAISKEKIPVEEDHPEIDIKHYSGPFELHFDRNGLKEIAVSSSLDSILDAWMDLAKLLNYGQVIATMPINTFDINEDPVTGRCKAHYTQVSDRLVDNEDDDDTKKNYDIVMMPSMNVPKGVKGFKRSSYLDKCPYRYDYYEPVLASGPTIIGRVLNDRIDMPEVFYENEVKSLKSRMAITSKTFSSQSDECVAKMRKGNLGNRDFYAVQWKKTMSINLVDIVPAKGPLDKISDPIRMRVYSVERREDTDSSE